MNYNPEATFEDGSCESYNYGCTDTFALNYDEDANTEDGSCEYCLEGAEYVAKMILIDSYGEGLTSGSVDGSFALYICGEQAYSGSDFGYQFTGVFYDCDGAQIVIFGCTDENAMNYSPDATMDPVLIQIMLFSK